MQDIFELMEGRGLAGDMYGGINALFTGLAFAGLIMTLIVQMRELELQREELGAMKDELSGQRSQMELQNEFVKKQIFENTFFQMMRMHNEIVSKMDIRTVIGRDCFQEIFSEIKGDYTRKKRIGESCEVIYNRYQQDLGIYFEVCIVS